jgi:hypothetical protein
LDFSWAKAKIIDDVHIIDTDFSLNMNKKAAYNQSNKKLRFEYTQRQRTMTMAATEAHNVGELRTLLVKQLAGVAKADT